MSWAPQLDYLGFDALETFSIKQGLGSPVSVNNCSRLTLTVKDIQGAGASGVLLQPTDIPVILRLNELAGTVPEPGDKIIDGSGVAYVIQWISVVPVVKDYRCLCRAPVSN